MRFAACHFWQLKVRQVSTTASDHFCQKQDALCPRRRCHVHLKRAPCLSSRGLCNGLALSWPYGSVSTFGRESEVGEHAMIGVAIGVIYTLKPHTTFDSGISGFSSSVMFFSSFQANDTYFVWLPRATMSLSLFMNLTEVYARVFPTTYTTSAQH